MLSATLSGGTTWEPAGFDAAGNFLGTVFDTKHAAGQPDVLWATHMDAGLLQSTDRGDTWTMVAPTTYDPATGGHYWNIEKTSVGDTTYYYTTMNTWGDANGNGSGKVFRSTDGANWSEVFANAQPAGQFMSALAGLAVDPMNPETVYISQDGGQIYKSTDNGTTWAPTSGQPSGTGFDSSYTFALTVDHQGRLFAGTLNSGLWRSSDGGASWQQVLTERSTIFHAETTPTVVLVSAGDANLYRSTDGGTTWTALTSFTSNPDGTPATDFTLGDQGAAIAVDPNDANHILYSRSDGWHPTDVSSAGIVETTDGGATWNPINDGLGNLDPSALAIAPDGTYYAGTWGGNIWRTATQAAPVTEPLFDYPRPLAEVQTWGYQIQDIQEPGAIDLLAASSCDLLVIELTRTDWSSAGLRPSRGRRYGHFARFTRPR